jgi:hypothetical protein
MCGRIEKFVHIFGGGGGSVKECDHLRGTGIDGSIILNWIIEKWGEVKRYIKLNCHRTVL